MNIIQRSAGITVVSMSLVLVTGCDTPSGAIIGAGLGAVAGGIIGHASGNEDAGIIIGGVIGGIAGGIIGQINERQRAQLQLESPQTLRTIQYNDEVTSHQTQTRRSSSPSSSPSPEKQKAPTLARLTVDDIKALSGASVKPNVIIAEIKKSKSSYSSQDIASAQSDASVDPSVIDYMKQTMG